MSLQAAHILAPVPADAASRIVGLNAFKRRPSQIAPSSERALDLYPSVDAVVEELHPSDPVFCLRPAELRAAAARFASFPGRALYAVKCNPHPYVLRALYEAGIRDFDVASIDEVSLIDGLFGKAAGMYFNNPAKSRPAIRSASNTYGIRFYTIDHASELEKILDEAQLGDDLVVAVRLATGSRNARYALSTKFGANPEDTVKLLKLVHANRLRVGLSFHVGSQCLSPGSFTEALAQCGKLIRTSGVPIGVLNVGGGFPAPYPGDDPAILEEYFASIIFGYYRLGLPPGCLLLCEPGRSLVATAGSVITQVVVRRDKSLFINDGVFGTLQELRHPKERRPARVIRPGRPINSQVCEFRVFGPTCDSDDVLGAPLSLPHDVAEGDWIEVGMMGAYSLSMRTRFNGFFADAIVAIG
jgi:ornithine decarboxylase